MSRTFFCAHPTLALLHKHMQHTVWSIEICAALLGQRKGLHNFSWIKESLEGSAAVHRHFESTETSVVYTASRLLAATSTRRCDVHAKPCSHVADSYIVVYTLTIIVYRRINLQICFPVVRPDTSHGTGLGLGLPLQLWESHDSHDQCFGTLVWPALAQIGAWTSPILG